MRAVFLLAAALLPALPAQVIRWSQTGQRDNYMLGGPAAAVADRDGDGFQDVAAVVQICDPPGGSCQFFAIWVLSGRDGRVLLRMPHFGYAGRINTLVAVGDADGDGARDYAISRSLPPLTRGVVEVRSGTDDRVLWSVVGPLGGQAFGGSLAGDLDLDGDGRPDLVVTASECLPDCSIAGSVYAYAAPGVLLYRITANQPDSFIGSSVAKVGDVDGDGCDDFVTASSDPTLRGQAYLISGRTGRELRRVFGAQAGDRIGLSCAGCDDLDADGIPDFAVGSGQHRSRGAVRVFSSATGRPIYDFTSGRSSFNRGFGSWVAGHVDVDQDGIDDILVADPEGDTGRELHAFSGRDGAPLFRFTGAAFHLATMAPQDGCPFPLLLATDGLEAGDRVSVHLLSAALPGVAAFGDACPGALTAAPRIGIRNLGGKGVRVHLSGTPPGAAAALALGLSRTQVPLDGIGMPGCWLLTSAELLACRHAGQTGLDAGYASVDIPLPLATGAGTFTLCGQWLAFDPGPVLAGGASAALGWRH